MTRSISDIMYISACIRDNNEILTPIPMFSGSSNTLRLMWILSDIGVTGISDMAANNCKYKYMQDSISQVVYE